MKTWVCLVAMAVTLIWIMIYEDKPSQQQRYTPKAQRWKLDTLYAWLAYLKSMICKHSRPWFLMFQAIWLYFDPTPFHTSSALRARRVRNALNKCVTRSKCPQHWRTTSTSRACLGATLIALQTILACSVETARAHHTRHFRMDTDSSVVGIDNRCTACLSHSKQDFLSGSLKPTKRVVKGFGGTTTSNVMVGTIAWTVEDDSGHTDVWHIPGSYYVPEGGVRLLSPQHWAQTRPHSQATCVTTGKDITLTWRKGKCTLTTQLDPAINVASFHLAPGYSSFHAFSMEAGLDNDLDPVCCEATLPDFPIVSDDEESIGDSPALGGLPPATENDSLTTHDREPVETCWDSTPAVDTTEHTIQLDEEDLQSSPLSAQLLRFHHRYNHISFHKLQHMARRGYIPRKLATCQVPTCSACLYGKATRKPWRTKRAQQPVQKAITVPGQVVCVDQLTSPTAGLVAQMSGFITGKRYRHATVFVDHATDCGYVHIQKSTSAEETIEAKVAFEKWAAAHGVTIQNYHADNGIFASQEWRAHCASLRQGLTFAGVNAHHQNGKVERRIRELQELARTMLIHAQHRWPQAINAHLWPYALRMASDAFNEAMGRDGRPSPLERFSRSDVQPNIKYWQPFGCPVFVLDGELQTTRRIKNKWEERSKIGVYLGRSPHHARSVALVLNLTTGHVSPQFHVMFDPSFQAIKPTYGGRSPPSQWQEKCGFTQKQDEPTPGRNGQPSTATRSGDSQQESLPGRRLRNDQRPQQLLEQGRDILANPDHAEAQPMQGQADDDRVAVHPEEQASEDRRIGTQVYQELQPETTAVTRTGRAIKPPQRLLHAMMTLLAYPAATRLPEGDHDGTPHSVSSNSRVDGEIFCMQALYPDSEVTSDEHPLLAYGATNDPDTLYWHEAMQAPDAEQFKRSMEKEFIDQLNNDNFTIIHTSEVPEGAQVLPSVWAMRRKRRSLDGEVYKWKSRLNMDGSKQRPEDFVRNADEFWQTYAPVATWSSIRLMLNLALQNNWHTVQLDYVQAYPQAPISKVQYMRMPKGILVDNLDPKEHVLKVTKNVYGGCDAGRTWNKFLVQKLIMIGFVQSEHDPCVFYKGSTMYVLYTDDSILAGPNRAEIDSIIKQMKEVKLDITEEGDVSDFLGVHITRDPDANTFELTQPRLITSILEDLGLDQPNSTVKDTPAKSSKILSRHPHSENFDGSFHYRRAIGKLNFLEKSTRADLAYSVHQCARFCADPKGEHGKAVKWIGRYLLGTRTKGIIMTPDPTKGLEVFVDADFAGAWDKELAGQDVDTARSRHGYVIMYAGTPVVWQSQLQTEIALSSTESELIGMSMALRCAIPLMHILNEMKDHGFNIHPATTKVICKVFEDNNGALTIAQVPKIRPRTKHINCKFFHFASYVEKGEKTLHRIDTDDQPADMLTKALDVGKLVKHRKFILGW